MSPEPNDQYKRLEGEEEEEGSEKKEERESERLTVEEMVNKTIGADNSRANLLKFLGLYMMGMMVKMTSPALSYIPIFAGFLNYKDWKCASGKCIELMTNFTDKPELFFSRDTICNNALQPNVDFTWTLQRTSYAMEWGLICSNESMGSNLKSFFFVGAFIGLFLGAATFDRFGRKPTTVIALVITCLSTLGGYFVNSYNVMLPVRIIQGIGTFTALNGIDLLSIEFTPSKLRNLCQIFSSCGWTFGSFMIVGVSYGVTDWHHIFLIQGCFAVVTTIIVLIYPESPRFHLIKGKEKEARATFRRMSNIFNTQEVSEKAELTYKDYDQSYLAQIKDFWKYPLMLKNTLLLVVCYLVISCISYGLLFSWGKLGADIYSTIFFGSLGGFIAKGSGMIYFTIHYFGRKKAVMMSFAGIAVVFFISIPSFGVRLSDTWNLDHVVCLCAAPFISGVWGSISLLTKELSPTSHRGTIMCMGSGGARIGAIVGPYMSLLYNTMDPRIVLAIFGGIAALASSITYFNSDSTDKPIPSTPEDLAELYSDAKQKKLVDQEDA